MPSATKTPDMNLQSLSSPVRIAAIQTISGPDVQANLDVVAGLIAEAAAGGAKLVALPEYFALISKDEADTEFFTLARQLRDRLQQIPRKVAPEIVALVVANPDVRGVTDLLDAAIREALEDLSR